MTSVTRKGDGEARVVKPSYGDTHLASGPLLLARWPRIFSTTVTLPLLAASSSSWSLPMVHLHRDQAAMFARTLVNLCFHYDYSRFIDPTWPSWANWRAAIRRPREAGVLVKYVIRVSETAIRQPRTAYEWSERDGTNRAYRRCTSATNEHELVEPSVKWQLLRRTDSPSSTENAGTHLDVNLGE